MEYAHEGNNGQPSEMFHGANPAHRPTELPLYRLLALSERLPSPERVVLTWFLRHDPPNPLTGQRKGVAWGKVGRMASELRVSERTVQNGSSGLVARGILSRDPENQLQYRIHYAALLRAASAERETVCEGCGRAIGDRERGTKRYHDSACRMRALRRRRRLERERSRRAAACDALLPSVIQVTLPGAQNGAPEKSARDAENNAKPPGTGAQPQGDRTNGHGGGISTKAVGDGDRRPSSSRASENGVAGAEKSTRDGECDANFHPPASLSVTPDEKAQGEGSRGHGAESESGRGRISARNAERDANLHPGVTLTCTPYQNVKTSKTYNDLNVDRLESESNGEHPTDADGRPKSRRRGSPNNNGLTPAKPEPRIQARIGHPKLQALLKSRRLQGLLRTFDTVLVERALLQADVQYSNRGDGQGIRNAYGLIYVMCRNGFDDELLREREERERRRRERQERERRMRALQERGCRRCGFWQVLESGYCTDCDPEYRARLPQACAGEV